MNNFATLSRILVLNCGSSSIKFALFDASKDPLERQALWGGMVQGIGGQNPELLEANTNARSLALSTQTPYRDALAIILQRVSEALGQGRLAAVAHRVVHGGSKYQGPVKINAEILNDLRNFTPLAPLHQPFALEAIDILLQDQPELTQIACFDTAFHHTVPLVEQMLPLPYDAWERGLRRYGFHGLSYEYLAHVLPERHGKLAQGKVIAAHLGSGASLCAMNNLKSQGTTMGFSALDGLMMGTRCGSIDPGAVIYLMEIEKLSLGEVSRILYHDSGLKGISGISGDLREVLAQETERPRAEIALALYVRRILREIGALTAILNGLDMLVFTAGVGERSAEMRQRICAELGWLGIVLDDKANQSNASIISAPESRVLVAVEPTNEEWVAARHAQALTI